MKCEWEPYEDKYRCNKCGFIVANNAVKKNCTGMPGIVQRAKNLGKAATNHIATGLNHCSEEERNHRLNICQANTCGFYKEHKDAGVCTHVTCGCFLRRNGKFMDKLSWADSKCPIGLW